MKRKLKKNRVIFIVVIICFVLLAILGVKLLSDYANDNEAIYGSRLDDIKNVQVSSKTKKDITDNISGTDKTKSVSVNVQGKIINVLVTLKDDTSRDDAKSLADRVLEKLSDKEKELYDIQMFISKDTDDAAFPIIGYKHHKRQGFTWTLDR